jgi:hypothetical protein
MLQERQATYLTALQLEQLCHPAQIERTMRLLFALNHWAKARERLFFVDRQGLYQVKAAILRQAYATGSIEATAYIDGKDGFGAELAFDMAADIAAEGFLWRMEELAISSPDEKDDLYDQIARRLYTKLTGRESILANEVEALETTRVREYILAQLQELERAARAARQPIPYQQLAELCVAPCDLLYIQDRRYFDLGNWDSWDQLDESDLRKLDPEGLSLLAVQYTSLDARYTFHLPLRVAEMFVPAWIVTQLQALPRTSRESGEYYGRAVTEAESLQQPIADILYELGVNIPATCPRLLSDKQEYALTQAMRFAAWSEDEDLDDDEEELDEDFWQDLDMLPERKRSRKARVLRESDFCPLCAAQVSAQPCTARLEHWQAEHAAQDLTISQASWILNRFLRKKTFCEQYPPDYRAPHERGWGARYWQVATLAEWLETMH